MRPSDSNTGQVPTAEPSAQNGNDVNLPDLLSQIAEKIIAQQEQIIGPVALEQARQVSNIKLDWNNHKVSITGDGISAINNLVEQYKELFGQISVEVCKEAAAKLVQQLRPDQLPESLK